MRFFDLAEACRYVKNLLERSYTIVCVGTYLRSDDRAALDLCEKLGAAGLPVISCEYGLENCVHEIAEKKARKIAIVDAAYTSEFAKGLLVISIEELENIDVPLATLSTHAIPMQTTLGFLSSLLGRVDVEILGIPVKNLDIGLELSPEVRDVVEALASCVKD